MPNSSARLSLLAGHELFCEGDASQELYMLVSGGVEVIMHGQRLAAITDAGALFGEMSFLLETTRTATVRTIAASEFLVIKDVKGIFDTQPLLMVRIARILAGRLKEIDEMFVTLRKTLIGT